MNKIEYIENFISGEITSSEKKEWLEKFNPHSGDLLSYVTDSTLLDIQKAISAAENSYPNWSMLTPVQRGKILYEVAALMKARKQELAECVALETGKSLKDALGEVEGAIAQAQYFSGEGARLSGRSLPSGVPQKYSHTIRQSIGVAGLIVPANTPIANIAWKIFPALICGNTVVLKASEDAPKIASLMGALLSEAGVPNGVLNVIHGTGEKSGTFLVSDKRVKIISFTGSTRVGKSIAKIASENLAKVSLELGGKNPFVVCDDADLTQAAHWAVLSAFSNAGQRCAAGSRLIVFENIYEEFMRLFIEKTKTLNLGVSDSSNLGPVISKKHKDRILETIKNAKKLGAKILVGGAAPNSDSLKNGYYIEPTVLEGLGLDSEIAQEEIFGPVVSVHKVLNFSQALDAANQTKYGLTAAIHTKSVDRAWAFAQNVRAGVVNINIGTYGSEPHMPFGGFGDSGNGTREPGLEALDVYSEIKNISFLARENLV